MIENEIPSSGSTIPLRVCVLGLGGGGFHFESQEILNNVHRPLDLILIFSGPGGGIRRWESRHPVRSSYMVRSPSLSDDSVFSLFYYGCINFVRALQILIAECPDLVFVVGSAQAIPFGLAAKLTATPLWFVESVTRVTSPSRTGNWLHRSRLYTKFFYFWPQLAHNYRRAICAQTKQ